MVTTKKLSVLAAVCALTASIGVAQAAEDSAVLQQVRGTVLVNQGESYLTASEGMTVRVGDQLMVMEQGSAILTYADGCAIPVTQDAVVTVEPATVSCSNRQAASQSVTTKYTALGEGVLIGDIIFGMAAIGAVTAASLDNGGPTPSN